MNSKYLFNNRNLVFVNKRHHIWGMVYRALVRKEGQADINVPKGTEIDHTMPKNTSEAADKYVSDKLRDLLFNMKETKTPKGVWFSTMMMSAPLFMSTGYLGVMTPMALNGQLVSPDTFGYVARTCVRLLGLNISFFGGVHYGLASAAYDTARTPEERRAISYQLGYSFVPALLAFCSSNILLFSNPLTS